MRNKTRRERRRRDDSSRAQLERRAPPESSSLGCFIIRDGGYEALQVLQRAEDSRSSIREINSNE